ncbi:MAG: phosphatidate cytidylyltransferase [Desulfurivibrionaceae bacterium]|nr:phosphatidate cytidylyltransferase [Desulfobulbales bacterium]MDT8334200.1 phosphatidate cytidylyltransferase [Desulfurivibrionaceae bacterium]
MNRTRIATGLIISGGWLALLLYGPFWLFWFTFLVLGALALNEYFAMTLAGSSRRDKIIGTFLGLLPLTAAYAGKPEAVSAGLFLSLFFLIVYSLTRYSKLNNERAELSAFALMMRLGFGVFYVGFSFSHFTLLLTLTEGKHLLILLTVITVFSDSFAYYTGMLLGRHKMAPAISPGKTVEGLLGGLAGSILGANLVCIWFFPWYGLVKITFLTIFISLVGVMGDLTESMIKRTMGVKDSGHILPGHGGVLDRLDSLMIAAPVLFYLLDFGLISL